MAEVSKKDLNFIAGEFVGAVSGNWLQKRLPRDPNASVQIPDSDLMDVVRAVQASNRALADWVKTTSEDRVRVLARIASLIEENAGDFADAAWDDLGTARTETLGSSIPAAIEHFRAHSRSIDPNLMRHEAAPVGIVGLILPASDPLVCLSSRVAPALAHRNAVICKPSRHTPATASLFARILKDALVPPGVFNVLQGRGAEVGEAVVRHPGIGTLSFMGSTETARTVAILAAESFKRIHFSLGAKNPVVVFANTDLTEVIPRVARLCLGQHPAQAFKGSRLFIQESVFKPALELLRAEIEKAEIAPLAKHQQVVRYNEAVHLALKENGRVITTQSELSASTEYFVKPYLFADLTNCSTLQQDEIAGPLILATSFKYQHEALKHANVSPYGRLGFVF